MSVLLGSSGASVILGSSGGGVVRRSASGTRTLLASTDITYLGSALMPDVSGQDTNYSAGLALRYVGGDLRLLSSALSGQVFEFEIDSLATTADYGACTAIRNWGDIYGGLRTAPGGFSAGTYGLYWDDTDSLLYWIFQNGYATSAEAMCIGASTLNDGDGSHTTVGSWGLPTTIGPKIAKGIIPIPSDFATAYTSGRRLGVGFGGYESVAATGPASMGPALVAIDPPIVADSGEYLTAATTILNHPWNATPYTAPMRGVRDASIHTEFDTWAPSGGVGYWTWTDLLRQSAAWVRTATKEGVLMLGRMSYGDETYVVQASPAPTSTTCTLNTTFAHAVPCYVGVRVNADTDVTIYVTAKDGANITFTDKDGGTTITPASGADLWVGTWYAHSTGWSSGGRNMAYVYAPSALAASAQGSVDPDDVAYGDSWQWTFPFLSNPLQGWRDEGPGIINGMAFDDTTGKLYVLIPIAHRRSWEAFDRAVISVYQVA